MFELRQPASLSQPLGRQRTNALRTPGPEERRDSHLPCLRIRGIPSPRAPHTLRVHLLGCNDAVAVALTRHGTPWQDGA